jgi:hypothetical protein
MLAESFCNVENGSSIIMSKSLSKNLINENKHTLCFQRIGILIHILSWKQQKHQCTAVFVFITEILLQTFWRNNSHCYSLEGKIRKCLFFYVKIF